MVSHFNLLQHRSSSECLLCIFSWKFFLFLQGYDGEAPILLKEEPDDGPRSFQKVPSLSDLSEESLGEYR
jgi:hypothetical protein